MLFNVDCGLRQANPVRLSFAEPGAAADAADAAPDDDAAADAPDGMRAGRGSG
jgi:hypothetical protein